MRLLPLVTCLLPLTLPLATPAFAGCLIAAGGAKCASAPTPAEDVQASSPRFLKIPVSKPLYTVGQTLPAGYSILLDTEYYGLPPVEPGWLYYRVGRDVLKVDRSTREVLGAARPNAVF